MASGIRKFRQIVIQVDRAMWPDPQVREGPQEMPEAVHGKLCAHEDKCSQPQGNLHGVCARLARVIDRGKSPPTPFGSQGTQWHVYLKGQYGGRAGAVLSV